jgi:hypothetical protein
MPATLSTQDPASTEDALLLIDAFRNHPAKWHEVLRLSVHQWDGPACGLFARAAKSHELWAQRSALADQLRGLANTAILREHQLKRRS